MDDSTLARKTFAEKLLELRQAHAEVLPSRLAAQEFIDDVLQLLFPHFSEKVFYSSSEIITALHVVEHELKQVLKPLESRLAHPIDKVITQFMNALDDIHDLLWLDAQAIFEGDPAAKSVDEVLLAYPGFFAIAVYRIAHEFYRMDVPIFPRILTEYAHQLTGIDIHPGAQIGKSFCIDHGTGIVIGETSVIEERVKMYQGVTLGGLSISKTQANKKRHPTIESGVVIYAHATILGGDTIIGKESVIGGNVWITSSVAAGSKVYHRSEIDVRNNSETRQS